MRAVNLIPAGQRKGDSVGAGRSEGAAYAVLAMLAAVAILAVLYGKASREVSSDKSKAATITAEAQQAQSEASALAPYTSFVTLRQQREQTVDTLVDTRFDWAHAFHEFGRVLSKNVSISSLTGTIGSTASSSGSLAATKAAAASTTVASATPPGSIPTFILAGCATSQKTVAEMMQRLRLIDGVSEVTLQSSTRGSSSGSSGAGGCPGTAPVFQVTVAFQGLPSAAAGAAAVKPNANTVADTTSGGK